LVSAALGASLDRRGPRAPLRAGGLYPPSRRNL